MQELVPQDFRCAGIFGDHMILQRGGPHRLWGWGPPHGRVAVFVDGEPAGEAASDALGRWIVEIPEIAPAGAHDLEVRGSGSIHLRDVWSGDVWICAGQSNMEFPLSRAVPGPGITEDVSRLRCFLAEKRVASGPGEDIAGAWSVGGGEESAAWSAIAYAFGEHLLRETGVPVGLIQLAWGGSPIEAWMPIEAIGEIPSLEAHAERCRKAALGETRDAMEAWNSHRQEAFTSTAGRDRGWASPEFDDSMWAACPVPGVFDEVTGDFDGAVWYRRSIEIPEEWVGRDLCLRLGVIDDLDHTYWNGVLVGTTGTDTPDYYKHSRVYTVPGQLVRAGSTTLCVRVFDEYLSGGFLSPEEMLCVGPADDPGAAVPLAGTWRIAIEQGIEEKPPTVGNAQETPAGIFHAMVEPLLPLPFCGVLWYQGENNLGNAARYRLLFPAMIEYWRFRGGRDFPFFFVQLAAFGVPRRSAAGSAWAELRAAQMAALALPHTAAVSAIDLGDAADIHPKNKLPVGRRLADCALQGIHRRADLCASGPEAEEVALDSGRLAVRFRHAEGLHTTDGRTPAEFYAELESGEIVPLDGVIAGDSVVFAVPAGNRVRGLRYAWADNPSVNLVNAAGLPAWPFRREIP
ncbi:sialate O-acetylesterase [Terrimicrobium sacchariphilum]|uniref:Sialate O-acetylesterase n=2 Tax=Terrimicrobium sacchariphilum TaxID=690879 RepID=A0A146G5L8_TERSA|nr:sialate O-acetylesterase [Terrimicrobium sacchariphilum]